MGSIFFAEDARWKSESERAMVAGAYTDYLAAKGITDLPPGFALTMVLVAYAVPRMNQPTVRQKIGAGIRTVWQRVKGPKQ